VKQSLIIVIDQHQLIAPQVTALGHTTLVITNEYEASDAFALVSQDKQTTTLILDHEESYKLYMSLHALYNPPDLTAP